MCCFILCLSSLKADFYEGVGLFQSIGKIDIQMLPQFLPYNPIVVEAGALYGSETIRTAKLWPKGRVIAFEPNPHAFSILKKKTKESMVSNIQIHNLALCNYNGTVPLNICYGMKGDDPAFEYASSVLPLTPDMQIYCKGVQIETPCVILDDWCEQAGIDHIDLLRLEIEGFELPVLESSPNILKTVKVIYVKTIAHPHRLGMTQYPDLKRFLEKSNFVLLSHWYQPEIIGYAIFLNREIFDAYFKLSLGIYQEI